MKGIVCAGGLGKRLWPLTEVTNKHLLPVYDRPMIFYPIQTLVKAGIKDIVVVTGGPYAGDFLRVLKSGNKLGIEHLYYAFQEEEGGIAQAIACARPYCQGENVAVILGDNCTDADVSGEVATFEKGAHLFLKKVDDPERFGVPAFDNENRIVAIYEKPSLPPSCFAVVGLYLFDSSLFARIERLKKSARGELEVTDLNNSYVVQGLATWSELEGFWEDAGTFDSLWSVGNHWRKLHGQ